MPPQLSQLTWQRSAHTIAQPQPAFTIFATENVKAPANNIKAKTVNSSLFFILFFRPV
jgi:hypothetical protein